MTISTRSPVCVVLTAAGGGYAITASTAQAIAEAAHFIRSDAFTEVLAVAEGTGAFGVGLLGCCAALGVALWCAALGIRLATGASALLRLLRLETLMMFSVGPLVVLGASGAGALLGTAAGSVLVWATQKVMTGLGVLLLVSCIIMRAHWLVMTQLAVFLTMQFIVMFLGMVLSFVHPGAYILMLILTWPVTGFPSRLCSLAQKLLRHFPDQLADSGHFLLYSFCMVVAFTGFVTGTTAFFLTFRQKPQQATEMLVSSCTQSALLCATIMGAVLGIYFMQGLKTSHVENVALGTVLAAMFALKGASMWLDSLGPCGTAGLLVGVATAAGLSLEAAVIAAKVSYSGPGAAGALLGAIGGAILGVISLSEGSKILLLSVTALVAVMANLERVEAVGRGEVRVSGAVEGAVCLGVSAFAMAAVGLGIIVIGLSGNVGFATAILGSLMAIVFFFVFTSQ